MTKNKAKKNQASVLTFFAGLIIGGLAAAVAFLASDMDVKKAKKKAQEYADKFLDKAKKEIKSGRKKLKKSRKAKT